MSKKPKSRVFVDKPKRIVIDMGPGAEISWIKAFPHKDGVCIESCCADGNVILSPEHVQKFTARLIEWSRK